MKQISGSLGVQVFMNFKWVRNYKKELPMVIILNDCKSSGTHRNLFLNFCINHEIWFQIKLQFSRLFLHDTVMLYGQVRASVSPRQFSEFVKQELWKLTCARTLQDFGKTVWYFWMGSFAACYKFPWHDMTRPGLPDLDPGSQARPMIPRCVSFETECTCLMADSVMCMPATINFVTLW